jgi:hypothetical protein
MPASILVNEALSDAQSLLQQILDQVNAKVRGRIREFYVLLLDGGLVLRGWTTSYYVKQLALQSVMEMTDLPIVANDIRVQRP